MGKQKDKKLYGFITADDPPADFIVMNEDDWEHADYVIKQTLQDFELYPKDASIHYSNSTLPFLGWFKFSLNNRIKRQNTSFAPHQEFEPTLAALDALRTLQDLLKDNGGINPEKAKIFLLSCRLLFGILRSGIGLKEEIHLHTPKEKRNKYILQYCQELKKAKPSTSAEHLLKRFPNRKQAAEIDGAKVFKEITEDGDLKAFCIMPDGKIKTVSLRKFHDNYFKESKKKKIS